MRITRLQLEDRNQAPLLEAPGVTRALNVIPLGAENRGDALPDLLHVVLYGHGDRATPTAAFGEVDLAAQPGRFRLRRRQQPDNSERFTIARLDGGAVPPGAIERLLFNLPVTVAERVFHANGRRGDQLSELLSEEVARVFLELDRQRPQPPDADQPHPRRDTVTHASRSAMLSRRDELARAIEDQLAGRRARSTEVQAEIRELDADVEQLLTRREAVDRRRMAVERELSALETRLRYRAISETVNRESDREDQADLGPQLDELDGQIERWRQTLAELELRESHVRSELAAVHPDDASPSITLADQRAGLAVATRLLQDLDGEVARLARAADSHACVCRDAHPRINPLVETLAKQIARLAGLASQQQRAFHGQQLKSESEHLARSQMDLQRQLDHLLTRRQELYRSTRTKRVDPAALTPVEPQGGAHSRQELQAELSHLTAELAGVNSSLQRLEHKRRELDDLRAKLLSSSELDALQRELSELQRRLNDSPLQVDPPDTAAPRGNRWRASELFARLTDGAWVGLRLVLNGRELAATDQSGQQRLARELSSSERRLASLALRLSLVWTAGQRGVLLPLVLTEPFAGLEPRQVVALATVLEDFGRAGRQLFVSTVDENALARFDSLGAHRLSHAPVTTPREFVVEKVTDSSPLAPLSRVTTHSVPAPEHLLSPDDGIERFPVPIRDRETVFLRSRIRTVGDLLGADPSAVAEELDRDDVTAELVALWQTHLAFVCFVPHLSFDDAVLLTGAGCFSPDELADLTADSLHHRAAEYLRSDRGARLTARGYRLDRDTASRWVRDAGRARQRWSDTPAWSDWSRHRGERRERAAGGSPRNGNSARHESPHLRIRAEHPTESRRNGASSNGSQSNGSGSSGPHPAAARTAKQSAALKFHLETSSPIVDAPSIGPKTAKRLEKAGVRTVADLIAADPELLAEKLDSSRIDAETLVAWQHQAQLVCRIPQLRGHDAQILVECGFTRPEELASMKPAELFGFVEPFCSTPEAERILRGGQAPDLAEVTNWIRWARQCRVLGAA